MRFGRWFLAKYLDKKVKCVDQWTCPFSGMQAVPLLALIQPNWTQEAWTSFGGDSLLERSNGFMWQKLKGSSRRDSSLAQPAASRFGRFENAGGAQFKKSNFETARTSIQHRIRKSTGKQRSWNRLGCRLLQEFGGYLRLAFRTAHLASLRLHYLSRLNFEDH